MMKPEMRQKAIEIISSSTSVKVAFNVPVIDNYSNIYEILILESNAALIKLLHNEGFSMSMTPKGLSINHY